MQNEDEMNKKKIKPPTQSINDPVSFIERKPTKRTSLSIKNGGQKRATTHNRLDMLKRFTLFAFSVHKKPLHHSQTKPKYSQSIKKKIKELIRAKKKNRTLIVLIMVYYLFWLCVRYLSMQINRVVCVAESVYRGSERERERYVCFRIPNVLHIPFHYSVIINI